MYARKNPKRLNILDDQKNEDKKKIKSKLQVESGDDESTKPSQGGGPRKAGPRKPRNAPPPGPGKTSKSAGDKDKDSSGFSNPFADMNLSVTESTALLVAVIALFLSLYLLYTFKKKERELDIISQSSRGPKVVEHKDYEMMANLNSSLKQLMIEVKAHKSLNKSAPDTRDISNRLENAENIIDDMLMQFEMKGKRRCTSGSNDFGTFSSDRARSSICNKPPEINRENGDEVNNKREENDVTCAHPGSSHPETLKKPHSMTYISEELLKTMPGYPNSGNTPYPAGSAYPSDHTKANFHLSNPDSPYPSCITLMAHHPRHNEDKREAHRNVESQAIAILEDHQNANDTCHCKHSNKQRHKKEKNNKKYYWANIQSSECSPNKNTRYYCCYDVAGCGGT